MASVWQIATHHAQIARTARRDLPAPHPLAQHAMLSVGVVSPSLPVLERESRFGHT
jgi:hypothetical protein